MRQPIHDNFIQVKGKEVTSFMHYSNNPNKIKQMNVPENPVVGDIFD